MISTTALSLLAVSSIIQIASPGGELGGRPLFSAHSLAADDGATAHANKIPRKFREIIQPVQFDGEYSPPVGRPPQAEPSPTVPVRYLSPAERALPVIVPPAPRYVDAPPTANRTEPDLNQINPTSSYIVPNAVETYQTSEIEGAPEPAPTIASGSATGSTAAANYGGLPQ